MSPGGIVLTKNELPLYTYSSLFKCCRVIHARDAFEKYLHQTMRSITTYTVIMLSNIVLSPEEYFLLIQVVCFSHAWYWCWPGLKGPVCVFTLVFQTFLHKKWKNILPSTTCIIWGNNIREEYMKFGESSFCIGFTVADDTPHRA